MSSPSRFVTVKRLLAVLLAIAIVVAAGVVVGQAPAIFGVEDDPEASITVTDQEGDGTAVTIDEVSLSEGGFVVLTDAEGAQVAVSDHLEDGTHEAVMIEQDEEGPDLVGQLTATVHRDTTDDGEFAYEATDGDEDRPYLADGFPVSDTAVVTTDDEEATLTESFTVESVDAPAGGDTDETITVTAVVENPTEFESQQPVEIRVDGELYEQQLVDLAPGESQELTTEVDLRGFEPGERTIGVYTDGDGAMTDLELSFHTDPRVAVSETTSDEVVVDVATPEAGFVALEDPETGAVLGTSEPLESGEHENVTITVDGELAADDDLVAALYAGDPDSPDDAEPIELQGEAVSATVSLESDDAGTNSSDETGPDESDDTGTGA